MSYLLLALLGFAVGFSWMLVINLLSKSNAPAVAKNVIIIAIGVGVLYGAWLLFQRGDLYLVVTGLGFAVGMGGLAYYYLRQMENRR